jgi:ubiquinone biosynthesis protein COQ9
MIRNSDNPRDQILRAALPLVAFEGWTDKMLSQAVKDAGLPEGAADLYFPEGVLDLLAYWSESLNIAAEEKLSDLNLVDMKIRDRVTQGVLARLEVIAPHEEAARRAMSRLALPDSFLTGRMSAPGQLWAMADMIWRAIGDTSTDGNFYSKRTILSGVIASTLPVWLNDDDPAKMKARAFLDARIANVMQFEKFKWQFKSATQDMPSPASILGAIRYGGLPRFRRRRRRG